MKIKKILKTVLIALVITLSSCNSEETKTNNTDGLLTGKWFLYKTVFGSSTYTGTELCDNYPICKTYEFKSNGTCIFYESGDTTNYTYKIDGDFIKFYSPQTEMIVKTYRIIILNNEELGLEQTDRLNYFNRF